jgi:hypothetical protein
MPYIIVHDDFLAGNQGYVVSNETHEIYKVIRKAGYANKTVLDCADVPLALVDIGTWYSLSDFYSVDFVEVQPADLDGATYWEEIDNEYYYLDFED